MLMWTDGEFDEDCGVLSSKRPSPIGGWLSPRFAISPPPMNEDNNSALSVRRRLGDPDRMELKTLDAQTKDTDLFVEKGLDLGTFSTNPAGVEVKVAKKKEASKTQEAVMEEFKALQDEIADITLKLEVSQRVIESMRLEIGREKADLIRPLSDCVLNEQLDKENEDKLEMAKNGGGVLLDEPGLIVAAERVGEMDDGDVTGESDECSRG